MPHKFSDSEWRDIMKAMAEHPKMSNDYANKIANKLFDDLKFESGLKPQAFFWANVLDEATSFSGESFATAAKVMAETTDRKIMSGKPIGTAHVNGKSVPIYEKMQ